MKTLGQLVLWGSLAGGVLSAATAYLAPLSAPDEKLLGLTLAAPAGRIEKPDAAPLPIARKDQQISAELLSELRSAGVRNVRVKQFGIGRWRGKWFFLLSLVGLAVGGTLVRFSNMSGRPRQGEKTSADSPEHLLQKIQSTVEHLRSTVADMSQPGAGMEQIRHEITQLQQTHMAAFVEARPVLVARLGLAGYARLMDSYAAAERQINRAWSAAADNAHEEAAACLDEASALLQERGSEASSGR